MFALIRPAAPARYVDHGSVHCPLRRCDVEVDRCAGCQCMTKIDLEAKLPFVRCRPAPLLPAGTTIWG